MVCSNAEAALASMCVKCISDKRQQTWIESVPSQARYNCTRSVWFDSQSVEKFFVNFMLPIIKNQQGKYIYWAII